MYALLLPSAHSFISAVEEKVNVDVRQIGVPTGAPTPWRDGSPPWMAVVCGPSIRWVCLRAGLFFIRAPFWVRELPQQAPIWRRPRTNKRVLAPWRKLQKTNLLLQS